MKISLRTKLVMSFLIVMVISGAVATVMGTRLIGDGIIAQAQTKVRLDLNTAREIYIHRLRDIQNILAFTAIRKSVREALLREDDVALRSLLEEARARGRLDVLTVTDRTGRVVLRVRHPELHGDDVSRDELIEAVLVDREEVASTEIVPAGVLRKEGEDLAARARLRIRHTPKAKPTSKEEETSGMMMKAAVPVFDGDTLVGVLYGGDLLNRHYDLVDHVKETVYQDERYKGRDIGTATIFQGDLRISTNVLKEDGTRAIGTRVSEAVYDQVLGKGTFWIDRAFVVNDWYIAAYEPIRDIRGMVIGILYVGILEQKFVDMKRETVWIFLEITGVGMAIALAIGCLLAHGISKPIRRLVRASEEISAGNLDCRVALRSKDEIGDLERGFNAMASSLKERDEQLKASTQQQLIRSERLASVGRMAAGIAHEINNPLTGVLTYSSMLLKQAEEGSQAQEDLQTIVDETMRCREIIKGLLDFSRQSELKTGTADINGIVRESLSLTENQALVHTVRVQTDLDEDLSALMVDAGQVQQVFINILLNAIDAMEGGGSLTVSSRLSEDGGFVEVSFSDTGCGIPPEDIDRIFDPFFTTKDVSKGTGLGLSISHGIVEKHNGRIHVDSQVGEGTTFTIELPLERMV